MSRRSIVAWIFGSSLVEYEVAFRLGELPVFLIVSRIEFEINHEILWDERAFGQEYWFSPSDPYPPLFEVGVGTLSWITFPILMAGSVYWCWMPLLMWISPSLKVSFP